jgi:tetratricopeptide (TPR) repeat protein
LGEKEVALLEKAKEEENLYNWIEAAKLYEQAAEYYLDKKISEKVAESYKMAGHSYERAAETVETAKEYIVLNQHSADAYKKAANLFKQIGDSAEELECKAEISYVNGLVLSSAKETKMLFSQSYEFFVTSSEYFRKIGDQKGLARTLSRAALLSWYIINYCSEQEEIEQLCQKCIIISEKAWYLSKEVKNYQAMAELVMTIGWTQHAVPFWIGPYKLDKYEREEVKKTFSLVSESVELIENNGDKRALGWVYFALGTYYGHIGVRFGEDEKEETEIIEKCIKTFESALIYAREIKDRKLNILVIYWLDYFSILKGKYNYVQKRIVADIKEIEELGNTYSGLKHLWSYYSKSLPAVYYGFISRRKFFTRAQRIIYSKKAIDYINNSLKHLAFGGFIPVAYFGISGVYANLAILATNREDRENYLDKMFHYANKAENFAERYKGGLARSSGYDALYRAYRTYTDITDSKEEKIKTLSKAIDAAEKGVEYSVESKLSIMLSHLKLGQLYEELGILSNENKSLIQAREFFLHLINETNEIGYYFITAAAYDSIARIDDRLGNHITSAENYTNAQNAHNEALNNIKYKLLKDQIKEKVNYSIAWNQIENAKAYHKKENHLEAEKHYENASEIFKNLPKYNYETSYYSAWALLEKAEYLSKEERQEDAIEQYKVTKIKFNETIKILEKASKRSNEKKEIERLKKLEKVAKLRVKYCSARINLEEARILGKQGKHLEAAEKFDSAASQFRDVCKVFRIERERKELEAIYHLCRAWQTMEFAEKYEDPGRFLEASGLFKKASDFFTETNLKFLASGNSVFCQALEYGCRFDDSTKIELKAQLYPNIKSMLRKAASLYIKGGYDNGADWALATSTYFDGTWNLIKADEELEYNEKGKLLRIGSRYLKSAAELFSKAGYKDKEEEIQNRLVMLEKEEEILFSAIGILKQPAISRSTKGIIAPSCPLETSQTPRVSEIQQITEESRKSLARRIYEFDTSLNILHISDIQEGRFGIKEDMSKVDEVYSKFLVDLKNKLEIIHRTNKIDIIAISGDLASTGAKEEFDNLTDEFFPILNDVFLKGKTIVPKNRWIIVPGNHDVEWGKKEARFNNFIQFCIKNGYHTYELNNPESVYTQTICREKNTGNILGIIGLNSCLEIQDEDTRNLSNISNFYFSEFSKDWDDEFREIPKLMICHHTLHSIKGEKLDHALNTLRDNNLLITLAGDIHKSEPYADEINRIKCIPAGTISAKKEERQIGIDVISRQFNLVNLNLQTGYVKWYTHIFEGTWREIKNESFYLKHPSFSKVL